MLAHEEDLVITADGAEWLSLRAPRQMTAILHEDATSPLGGVADVCSALMRDMAL